MKDVQELRKLEAGELQKELRESKKKLFELKMKLVASELKQTHLIKPLRKYIALLQTILSEKSA